MSWFQKLMPARIRTEGGTTRKVPDGLWTKCKVCDAVLYQPELERSLQVCPKCDFHMSLTGRARLKAFLDEGEQVELGTDYHPIDPLRFRDSKKYRDRLNAAQRATGESDALIVMRGQLRGLDVVSCAFDFRFMGGSMGSVVGERFMVAVHECLEADLPLVCFAASGGARMQEGLFSLMQMARTSAGLARMAERGLPYICVLTHPTTGGVSASLGMLGDINLAEPNALIGFAGPRVIEQTVRETLPEGFQRSEFLLEKGAIDQIVDRRELRQRIHALLGMMLSHRQALREGELLDRNLDGESDPAILPSSASLNDGQAEQAGPDQAENDRSEAGRSHNKDLEGNALEGNRPETSESQAAGSSSDAAEDGDTLSNTNDSNDPGTDKT